MDEPVIPPPDDEVPDDKVPQTAPADPPRRKAPPLSPRARRWAYIGAGTLAFIVVIVALVANLWNAPRVTGSEQVPKGPIATRQPTPPNSLDEVRGWFGPWQMATDDSGSPQTIVMLGSAGNLEISSYGIAVDDSWLTDNLTDLDVQVEGQQVLLRSNSGKIYRVKPGQPFILDTRPNQVYAVKAAQDGSATVFSQPTTWVHAHSKTGK